MIVDSMLLGTRLKLYNQIKVLYNPERLVCTLKMLINKQISKDRVLNNMMTLEGVNRSMISEL